MIVIPKKPLSEEEKEQVTKLIEQGIRLLNEKKQDNALICLNKVLSIDPDNFTALYRKGMILNILKKHNEALKVLQHALKIESANCDAFYEKGRALSNLAQYEDAIALFEKIVQKNPNHIRALESMAFALKKVNSYREARNLFLKIAKVYENESGTGPDTDEATRIRNKKIAHNWIAIGNTFSKEEKFDQAREWYTKALNLDKNDTEALNQLGVSYSQMGNDQEAIRIFNKILEINSSDKNALISKGYSLSKVGRDREAIQLYETMLKEFGSVESFSGTPDDKRKFLNALNSMGFTQMKVGKHASALDYFDKAIRLDPKDYRAYDNKGKLLLKQRKYQEASDWFDKGIDIEPTNVKLLHGKGVALLHCNRLDDAIYYFDNVLSLDKNFSAALADKSQAVAKKELAIADIEYQKFLMDSIQEALEHSQDNLCELSDKLKKGLNSVNIYFHIQFILGICLLVSSVILRYLNMNDAITAVLGTIGGFGLITTAILTSPMRIQKNRIDYSQWLIAYFNWISIQFSTSLVLLEKIRNVHESKNAGEEKYDWNSIQPIQEFLHTVCKDTIVTIEENCEFKEANKKILKEKPAKPKDASAEASSATSSPDKKETDKKDKPSKPSS